MLTPLRIIKLAHTAIWAVMAGAIIALPYLGWLGHFDWVIGLSILVLGECVVLAVNRFRCPLTDLAARYAEDQAVGFDIYLPPWLARYNKLIFGTLFVMGELVVVIRLMLAPGQ